MREYTKKELLERFASCNTAENIIRSQIGDVDGRAVWYPGEDGRRQPVTLRAVIEKVQDAWDTAYGHLPCRIERVALRKIAKEEGIPIRERWQLPLSWICTGWNSRQMVEMEEVVEYRLSLLKGRENDSLTESVRDRVLEEYKMVQDKIPLDLTDREGNSITILDVYDFRAKHSPSTGQIRAVIALVSIVAVFDDDDPQEGD